MGGAWSYDKDYLEMTRDGGAYTFKALKAGQTAAVYTVDGVSFTVTITINSSSEDPSPQPEKTTPQTGDTSNTLPFVLLTLASLLGCIGLISYKKLGRKKRQG